MGQADRDYWKTGYDEGLHPPACTCADCNEKRIARNETHIHDGSQGKKVRHNSLAVIVIVIVIIAIVILGLWGLYVFDVL